MIPNNAPKASEWAVLRDSLRAALSASEARCAVMAQALTGTVELAEQWAAHYHSAMAGYREPEHAEIDRIIADARALCESWLSRHDKAGEGNG